MICTSVPDKTSYYQAGCTFQKPFYPWSGSAPPPINKIMDNLATLQPNSKQRFTIFQLLLILISYFWPASAPFNWLKWRHATPSVTKFKANLKRRFFFLLHLAMIRIDFLNNIALLTPNMSLAQKLKCGLLVGKRRLTSHEDVC